MQFRPKGMKQSKLLDILEVERVIIMGIGLIISIYFLCMVLN